MTALETGSVILRLTVGLTMCIHGGNHLFGPGGVTGTAEWFCSMGLRPPRMHATLSGVGELVTGVALVVGLFTPLAAAFVVGVMTVAGVIAHGKNGFFIFKDGYEYVVVLASVAICIGVIGPGRLSLDYVLGLSEVLDGLVGGLIAGLGGVAAAASLLAACWRPAPPVQAEARGPS